MVKTYDIYLLDFEQFKVFTSMQRNRGINTTMIYTHITPQAERKIISPLDNLVQSNLTPKKIGK